VPSVGGWRKKIHSYRTWGHFVCTGLLHIDYMAVATDHALKEIHGTYVAILKFVGGVGVGWQNISTCVRGVLQKKFARPGSRARIPDPQGPANMYSVLPCARVPCACGWGLGTRLDYKNSAQGLGPGAARILVLVEAWQVANKLHLLFVEMFWRLVVCLFAALGLNGQNAGMYVGGTRFFFSVFDFCHPWWRA